MSFVDRLDRLVTEAGYRWIEPHHVKADGEESLEWWVGSRKLTIYVEADEPVFLLRVWGSNMDTEMDELSNPTHIEIALSAWPWLLGGEYE